MRRLARIVAFVLSLTLMVGAVAHAAQSTSMAIDMTAGAHSDGSMRGCDGCPGGDEDAVACAAVCLPSPIAVLPMGASVAGTPAQTFALARTRALVDHSRPPDPYPPRTIVLG